MAKNRNNVQIGITYTADTSAVQRELSALGKKELSSLTTDAQIRNRQSGAENLSLTAEQIRAIVEQVYRNETKRAETKRKQTEQRIEKIDTSAVGRSAKGKDALQELIGLLKKSEEVKVLRRRKDFQGLDDTALLKKVLSFTYAQSPTRKSDQNMQARLQGTFAGASVNVKGGKETVTILQNITAASTAMAEFADSAQHAQKYVTVLNANAAKTNKLVQEEVVTRQKALDLQQKATSEVNKTINANKQLKTTLERMTVDQLDKSINKSTASIDKLDRKLTSLQTRIANAKTPRQLANVENLSRQLAETQRQRDALASGASGLASRRQAILREEERARIERDKARTVVDPYAANSIQGRTVAEARRQRDLYKESRIGAMHKLREVGGVSEAEYREMREGLLARGNAIKANRGVLGDSILAGNMSGEELAQAKALYQSLEDLARNHYREMDKLDNAYLASQAGTNKLKNDAARNRAKQEYSETENRDRLAQMRRVADAVDLVNDPDRLRRASRKEIKDARAAIREGQRAMGPIIDNRQSVQGIMPELLKMFGADSGVGIDARVKAASTILTDQAKLKNALTIPERIASKLGYGPNGAGFLKSQGFRQFQGNLGYTLGGLGIAMGAGGLGYAATNLVRSTGGAYMERTATEAGIAGLTNTYTRFNDAQGRNVSPVANFSLSVNSAKAMYNRLREASKETLVTPQELAESFMSGAPALRNKGFSEDQALKLTSRIVAMGRAMNLPSAAIQSDIRDFARGNVTRNSQVLQALGLNTKDLAAASGQGPEAAMRYFEERVAGFEPAFKKLREELPGQINELRIELEAAAQDIGMYATPNLIKGIQAIRKELVSFGQSGGFERIGTQLGQMVAGLSNMLQKAVPVLTTVTASAENAIGTVLGGAITFAAAQAIAMANPIAALGVGLTGLAWIMLKSADDARKAKSKLMEDNLNKGLEVLSSTPTSEQKVIAAHQFLTENAQRIREGKEPLSPQQDPNAVRSLSLKSNIEGVKKLADYLTSKNQMDSKTDGIGAALSFLVPGKGADPEKLGLVVAKAAKIRANNAVVDLTPDLAAAEKQAYEATLDAISKKMLHKVLEAVSNVVDGPASNPPNALEMGTKNFFSLFTGGSKGYDTSFRIAGVSRALTEAGITPEKFKKAAPLANMSSQDLATLQQGYNLLAGQDTAVTMDNKARAAMKAAEAKMQRPVGITDDQWKAMVSAAKAEAYDSANKTSISSGTGAGTEAKEKAAARKTSELEARIARLQYAAQQADRQVQRTSDFAVSGGGYLKLNALKGSMNAGIAVARAEYELGVQNANENSLGNYEIERLQTQLAQSIENVTNAYEDQRRAMEMSIEQQKLSNKLLADSNALKKKDLEISNKEFEASKLLSSDIEGRYAAGKGIASSKAQAARMSLISSLNKAREEDRIQRLEYAQGSSGSMSASALAEVLDGVDVSAGSSNVNPAVAGQGRTISRRVDGKIVSTSSVSASVPGGAFSISKPNFKQTSGFGPRGHFKTLNGKSGSRVHGGQDFAVRNGTPIKASADGKVTTAGVQRGYGGIVVIDHGPVETAYAHLSRIDVKVGEIVKKGQVIGLSGGAGADKMSGNSTGAHLHFETRVNGKTVNPDTIYGKPFTSKGFTGAAANIRYSGAGVTQASNPAFDAKQMYPLLDGQLGGRVSEAYLDYQRQQVAMRSELYGIGSARATGIFEKFQTAGVSRRARYDVLTGDFESEAMRKRALQGFDAQAGFDKYQISIGERAQRYAVLMGEREIKRADLEGKLAGASSLDEAISLKLQLTALSRLIEEEPNKALGALADSLTQASMRLKDFTDTLKKLDEIEKAKNDRDALGIEQSISSGTRGYDRSMSRLGNLGRIDSGFFSTDSIRGTYTESGQSMQDSAQAALDMQIANDKSKMVYTKVGKYGMPTKLITQYEANLQKDPQYYNKIRQSNIRNAQSRTLGMAGKDRLLGNPALAGLIQGGIGSIGGLDMYKLLANPEGRLEAFNGLVSPITAMAGDSKASALSMIAAGVFSSDASLFANPAFNKYMKVGQYGVPAGFDRKRMMADAGANVAAGIGGDIAGNFIGNAVFRGKDPAAISAGTSLGGALGATMLTGLGPWGAVVGAVGGGLLGGLFGGKKKDPREEQEKENRRNFQRRIEDSLNTLNKRLGPQEDYYRAIVGDLLYGSASAYYSGRAYSRIGIGYNMGGR